MLGYLNIQGERILLSSLYLRKSMSVYKLYSAKPKDQLASKIYFTKTKINAKIFQLDTGDFRKYNTIHTMV